MKLLYFAWLRTMIGAEEEDITLPSEIRTVGGLRDWLADRGPGYAEALANPEAVRIAVNQEFAEVGDPVSDRDEIALFPPMTGG